MQSIPSERKDHPLLYQILCISPPGPGPPSPAGGGHVSRLVSPTLRHLTLFERADAPDNEKSPFGSREPNVQSPPVSEKSNLSRRIIAHSGKDDHFLFPTLKPIDSLDIDVLEL